MAELEDTVKNTSASNFPRFGVKNHLYFVVTSEVSKQMLLWDILYFNKESFNNTTAYVPRCVYFVLLVGPKLSKEL